MNRKIRILIVDDHAMVRLGLSQAIERQPDLELVGEAANGARALELYRSLRPDVVTMDYQLPGPDGVAVTAAIRAEFPDAGILLLSIYEGQDDVWRATQAGATGYLSKSVEVAEVISGIRRVAARQAVFSAGLKEKLAARQAGPNLTPRELDVLRLLVRGRSNKELSSDLGLSQSTVKHHIESIFAKLGVQDRTQATAVAVQRGVVRLEP